MDRLGFNFTYVPSDVVEGSDLNFLIKIPKFKRYNISINEMYRSLILYLSKFLLKIDGENQFVRKCQV